MPKVIVCTDALDRIDKLLKTPNPLLNSGEVLEVLTVDFFDGRYAELRIISPPNPAEETCWLQSCLYEDADLPCGGTQAFLVLGNVEDEIYTEHVFEWNNVKYVIDIRKECL